MEYGATVLSIFTRDRDGNWGDVLLGCSSPIDYLNPHPHFNCIVGRFSNRITKARFKLNGKTYRLPKNASPHHLHGGNEGFHSKIWTSYLMEQYGVSFKLTSPDGDCGYPGELKSTVIYYLEDSSLGVVTIYETTKPTPVSLTSHLYFNLNPGPDLNIENHSVTVTADQYLPVSKALTQQGVIESVEGSPFDLRTPQRLGDRLNDPHPQIQLAQGFDHSFVWSDEDGKVRERAEVLDPDTGRKLRVHSNMPALQLYTTNTLNFTGKLNRQYTPHSALCLETQQYPDAPNQSNYPDSIAQPKETYECITIFEFG